MLLVLRGGLTNSCEKKRSKKQRRKGKIYHLNAEFQSTARRHKKAFLSDQCKEIEENNRMGKTRDLFKKIRDTKGIFHAKVGSIKDRNGRDLTEAEDIRKRGQEYTEEWYKRDLHDPDDHNGVVTNLESDILECKVMWALGSKTTNKPSGGDGISQARILEWAAISFSRVSSQPRDQTWVSCVADRRFTI